MTDLSRLADQNFDVDVDKSIHKSSRSIGKIRSTSEKDMFVPEDMLGPCWDADGWSSGCYGPYWHLMLKAMGYDGPGEPKHC